MIITDIAASMDHHILRSQTVVGKIWERNIAIFLEIFVTQSQPNDALSQKWLWSYGVHTPLPMSQGAFSTIQYSSPNVSDVKWIAQLSWQVHPKLVSMPQLPGTADTRVRSGFDSFRDRSGWGLKIHPWQIMAQTERSSQIQREYPAPHWGFLEFWAGWFSTYLLPESVSVMLSTWNIFA